MLVGGARRVGARRVGAGLVGVVVGIGIVGGNAGSEEGGALTMLILGRLSHKALMLTSCDEGVCLFLLLLLLVVVVVLILVVLRMLLSFERDNDTSRAVEVDHSRVMS